MGVSNWLIKKIEWATAKRKRVVIIGILVTLVVVAGFFAVKGVIEAPRDLGPDLVYIGQYGNLQNNPIAFFLFPDSEPWVNYYFGTNISTDELRHFITKAGFSYDESNSGEYMNAGEDYFVMSFKPNKYSPNGLLINDYNANDPAFYSSDSSTNYIRTNKKHVLEMLDHEYRELRDAMQNAKLLGR